MHEEGRPVLDRAPLTIASDGRAILPGFAVGAGGVLAERRVAMEVLTALGMGGENARVSIDASQARALLNYDKLAGPDADDEAGRRMVLTRASDIKPARGLAVGGSVGARHAEPAGGPGKSRKVDARLLDCRSDHSR